MRVVGLLALAALFLIVLFGTMPSRSEPAPPLQCMDQAMSEQVRDLVLAGIDQALKNQTTHLFEVWMKDPRGQPARVRAGMRNAITAYARSRADALRWLPPLCSGRS